MEYIKLIALDINDLSSSIFFEDNYALNDIDEAKVMKNELESKGYLCLLAKTVSSIEV